jgi:hypothetical protein
MQIEDMANSRLIQALENESSDILFKLRSASGLDRPAFRRLLSIIDQLSAEWVGNVQLPKSVAGIFFDIYPAMMSASYQYPKHEQQEVMQAADELADHIRSVFNTDKADIKKESF